MVRGQGAAAACGHGQSIQESRSEEGRSGRAAGLVGLRGAEWMNQM